MRDPEEALRQLDRLDSQESLYDFMRLSWHVLHPSTPFVGGWAIETMCRHLEAVSRGDINKLLINVPPGCTKAARIDTPVLTTHGWREHGQLRPGDFVFAPDGQPRRVEAVTPHFATPEHSVEFDDGTHCPVSHAHEWVVQRDYGESPRVRRDVRVETHEIKAGGRPDCIPVSKPVCLPPQYQLIDPYLLGAWLGDGSRDSCFITAHHEDTYVLRRYGAVTSRRDGNAIRLRIPGLQTKLRVMGLLKNKHIPRPYMLGSVEQRWELLRGLMDTDGCATKSGNCHFSQSDGRLARQVQELACSLGLKAAMHHKHTKFNGKLFDYWLVTFTPPVGDVVFRLSRKQGRLDARRKDNPRVLHRYIRSVAVGEEATMNCIQVEGGMYLLGRNLVPTSNSMLSNVFLPAWEWGPKGMPHIQYLSASYEKGLTTRDLVYCRDLLKSEWYQERWPISFKEDDDGKSSYANTERGWRFATSVGAGTTGRRGQRFIIDDPHSVGTAESDAERADTRFWFTETTPTRFTDPKKPVYVVIMQRLHEDDISGLILKNLEGWTHLVLPMEYPGPETEEKTDRPIYRCMTAVPNPDAEPRRVRRVMVDGDPIPYFVDDPDGELLWPQDPRTEPGELLWPERFDRESVDGLKSHFAALGGSYAVSCQLDQRPVPRGGGMFQRDDFSFLDRAPDDVVDVCRGWDLAASTTKRSAYTTAVKLGRRTDGSYVILDVERFRGGPGEVMRRIKEVAEQDGHDCPVSLPQDPGQAGKSQKAYIAQQLDGWVVHFSPETGSKEDRARPLSAQAEAGNVALVRGAWNDAFLAEASMFPAGTYKDQIDAASRAHQYILRAGGSGISTVPGRVYHG